MLDWAISQRARLAEAAALRVRGSSTAALGDIAPPVLLAGPVGGGAGLPSRPIAPASKPTHVPAAAPPVFAQAAPREPTPAERAECAADLAPSSDGAGADLAAFAAMIARAEKVSPIEGLRRAHARYERLSIAARTGRDPGPRSSWPDSAPARSTSTATQGVVSGPADIMAAARQIQAAEGCNFREAMSRAHKRYPELSHKARTLGVS